MKISRHANGKLYTTLTVHGDKKFVYGDTPEEIEIKYTELKHMYHQGYNITDNPTLKDYMITWYKTFKAGNGAIETQKMYQNCINTHINPALGSKKIKEITGTQIQSFLNGITSSKSLAHKVRITLNQIFKQAIADHLIAFNPVSCSKVIAPDDPERSCLSAEQYEILLTVLKNHRTYPYVFTLLYSGVRMGELFALLWKDINLQEGQIRVTRGTEYDQYKPKHKAPKTKNGIRTIPIPQVLREFLETYKNTGKKSLYVFPGHSGGPMGLTEIKRIWGKANQKLAKWFKEHPEAEEHKFHLTFRLLRHTYCTALYDAGIDEKSAAELMGHDVTVMMKIYRHIQKERKKNTISKIETLYAKPNVTQISDAKISK